MRLSPHSQPKRPGRRSKLPPALGPALEATIKLQQLEGLTGGMHKRDLMEVFKATIAGSAFEELFKTADQHETAYRTWLTTEAGALSRSLPTVNSEQDVNRLNWMKASVLVLQYGGLFAECIRLGLLAPISHLLEEGAAGADNSRYAEFGLNYTQGMWKEGALDVIKFCDEIDKTISYNPRKGGHNIQIFARKLKITEEAVLADLPRMQASLKGLMKITCCGSFTLSGQALANAYYFALTAKACPEVFLPECQVRRGCGDPLDCCGQCDCDWFTAGQVRIVRSDLRCMPLGLAARIDPTVRGSGLNGRMVSKSAVDTDAEGATDAVGSNRVFGTITSHCSAEALAAGTQKVQVRKPGREADWWEVKWQSAAIADAEPGGTTQFWHYTWEELVPMLLERDAHLDAGDETAALALGRIVGRSIKPEWIRGLPVANVHMDGRDKRYHCKVCYNPSGGRTALTWQRFKKVVFGEVHDECSIMNRTATISDGATGLLNAVNQIADLLDGRHGLPTCANASAATQPSDDKSLHGHATNVEEAEGGDILVEKRTGRKAGACGPALAANPAAKLEMSDLPRIACAGWKVMSDRRAMNQALKRCGFKVKAGSNFGVSIAEPLENDKVLWNLDGTECVSLRTTVHNTHVKALIALIDQGMDPTCLTMASGETFFNRRQRAPPITQEDLFKVYDDLRGRRKSTGARVGFGLFSKAVEFTAAHFAGADDIASVDFKQAARACSDHAKAVEIRQHANVLRRALGVPATGEAPANRVNCKPCQLQTMSTANWLTAAVDPASSPAPCARPLAQSTVPTVSTANCVNRKPCQLQTVSTANWLTAAVDPASSPTPHSLRLCPSQCMLMAWMLMTRRRKIRVAASRRHGKRFRS